MMDIKTFGNAILNHSDTERMPALFVGHGNPMNAITDNPFTQTLKKTGLSLPKPKAILVVSAHWLTRGIFVSSASAPKTIHDFGGFPRELFEVQYPAPGSPYFAQQVKEEIQSLQVQFDHDMGFDHGA